MRAYSREGPLPTSPVTALAPARLGRAVGLGGASDPALLSLVGGVLEVLAGQRLVQLLGVDRWRRRRRRRRRNRTSATPATRAALRLAARASAAAAGPAARATRAATT